MINIHESLLVYHANRYQVNYRIGSPLLKIYHDCFGKNVASVFDHEARLSTLSMSEIWGHIASIIRASIREDWIELHNIKLNNLEIMERWGAIVSNEMEMLPYVGSYFSNGKNIFDFSGRLASLFRHTTIGDCPTDFNLPYDSLYLYFSPQHDLCFQDNYLVDGAYVVKYVDGLGILFTTICINNHKTPYNRTEQPDVFFECKLNLNYDNFGDAISDAFYRNDPMRKPFEIFFDPEASTLDEEAQILFRKISLDRHSFLLKNFNNFKNAISLVINSIFYMDSYPEDIIEDYPDSAPTDIVEQIKTAPVHRRKRLTQSLVKQGFTTIKFPIERYSNSQTNQQSTTLDSDTQAEGYWVRGHKKNQAFGKGLSERRRIWIKPYKVREPSHGHIYTVDSDCISDQ